jgi:hypothetical protein
MARDEHALVFRYKVMVRKHTWHSCESKNRKGFTTIRVRDVQWHTADCAAVDTAEQHIVVKGKSTGGYLLWLIAADSVLYIPEVKQVCLTLGLLG